MGSLCCLGKPHGGTVKTKGWRRNWADESKTEESESRRKKDAGEMRARLTGGMQLANRRGSRDAVVASLQFSQCWKLKMYFFLIVPLKQACTSHMDPASLKPGPAPGLANLSTISLLWNQLWPPPQLPPQVFFKFF